MMQTMYPQYKSRLDTFSYNNIMSGLFDEYRDDILTEFKLKPRVETLSQPETTEVDNPNVASNMDYRFEEARLQSFEGWPKPFVHPNDLAAAGFYFTKQIDRVRCFECGIEVCLWEEGDDPMSEHQRWGGRCRYIRRVPCGNVPIGADAALIPHVPRGRDTCGPYGVEIRPSAEADTYIPRPDTSVLTDDSEQLMTSPRLGSIGIAIPRKADCPEYAAFEKRLQSFTGWPKTVSITKEQMAEAGFYYSGNEDHVKCYHCGGALNKWEPNDDPWTQHAKWYPGCLYLQITKGQEFINNLSGKEMPSYSAEEIGMLNIPNCIKTVEKAENETKSETAATSEASENAAGPSSACPTPLPRTSVSKSQESVPSSSTSVSESTESNEKKSTDDVRACKICYNGEVGVVFLPCGHIVACVKCAPDMRSCAVCRKPVTMYVRAFLA